MPIVACMIVNYWLIRNGNFHVPSMHVSRAESPYIYYKGWNLRMLLAWVAGIALTVHGVAGSLNPDSAAAASKYMYKLGFLLSCCMGAVVYYVLCLIWLVQILSKNMERHLAFEELAATEGFFDHESIGTITVVIEGEDVDQIYAKSYVAERKESKI